MKFLGSSALLLLLFLLPVEAQVPLNTQIQILKAEDARRYDAVLEKLLGDPSPGIRKRAALAAGRIGDEKAIDTLGEILQNDKADDVRAMAAFAIGEIESVKGADATLKALSSSSTSEAVRARAIEAAGKIAAANPKDPRSKELADAILAFMKTGADGSLSTQAARLGLTAVLRARPAGAEDVVKKYLAYTVASVQSDALNTLIRLRAKNSFAEARDLLSSSADAVVQANAARLLAGFEDKQSIDALLNSARNSPDIRVRVSAIRALASSKNETVPKQVLAIAEEAGVKYKASAFRVPAGQNELLELFTALGRLYAGTGDQDVISSVSALRSLLRGKQPESEIAFARIAPKAFVDSFDPKADWKGLSAQYQGLAELANLDASTAPEAKLKARLILVQEIALRFTSGTHQQATAPSRPDLVRAFAAFKSENTSNIFRPLMEMESDVFVRAAIAETLADQGPNKENVEELNKAFTRALLSDKLYDDAQLAILDALAKLDKKSAVGTLGIAMSSPDYLVRKKAFDILDDEELQKEFPGLPTSLENYRSKRKDQVLPYTSAFGTKLGQVLNTDLDYRRAAARRNGSVKAVVKTEKGTFTIDFLPEDAPLTVDNFIKLARANYFNGVEVHRVVPNFVMQDGDPRGDGNGGPGWSIRCEINMVPYERGAVGMALSGKDTGGSQWFVTHSPQPHLDGGYTVFGRVNETDMRIVDNIVRGDKILTIRIIGR